MRKVRGHGLVGDPAKRKQDGRVRNRFEGCLVLRVSRRKVKADDGRQREAEVDGLKTWQKERVKRRLMDTRLARSLSNKQRRAGRRSQSCR